MRKSKSLHSITIEHYTFITRLFYNLNTNYIGIRTSFQYQDPNKTKEYNKNNKANIHKYNKEYYENNKDKAKEYAKQHYKNNRDPNITIMGSEEYRIKLSCIQAGIDIEDWNGFIRNQKYCKLFSEKFKQSIRDRYHNKCFLCNTTKKDNQNRKLSVHHVNYNKSCLCSSSCEFVPLCSKCHGKTNKNRQTWEDLIMNYLYPNRYFMVEIF